MIKPRPLRERLLEKLIIEPETGCLLWSASTVDGYGKVYKDSGTPQSVHRWMYQEFVGPIPPGMEIDHLCRVRHCASPAHLEAVTHGENMRRGWAAWKAAQPDRWGQS